MFLQDVENPKMDESVVKKVRHMTDIYKTGKFMYS